MDDLHFDAWTRRRFGLAAGGVAAAFLGLTTIEAVDAKRTRKKKKKCKKSAKRCGKKCIPKSACCTDADCGSGGATCQGGACRCPDGEKDCQGTCIPDDECCPGTSCAENCQCERTVEGTSFCVQDQSLIECEQCNSSAECENGSACVPTTFCGAITALCLPPCAAAG